MSEYEPITTELRRVMNHTTMAGIPLVEIGEYEFGHRCDAIDAVHASLERENAELRQRVAVLDNERGNMHDCGRITDELREYAEAYEGSATHASLDLIADRIDAEHESACAEAYGNGVMSVPIALDESQWVKLPVDADGEPIHIGDVMENIVCPSVHREVTGVGVECFYGWDDGNGRYSQFSANCYRHHHAPTVEDVLREFGRGWHEQMNGPETFDVADYVERYAAKLRLAGDES